MNREQYVTAVRQFRAYLYQARQGTSDESLREGYRMIQEKFASLFPSPSYDRAIPILESRVADMEIGVRARKALFLHLGVITVEDLTTVSEEELLVIKNCGTVAVNEIKRELAKHGLRLKS